MRFDCILFVSEHVALTPVSQRTTLYLNGFEFSFWIFFNWYTSKFSLVVDVIMLQVHIEMSVYMSCNLTSILIGLQKILSWLGNNSQRYIHWHTASNIRAFAHAIVLSLPDEWMIFPNSACEMKTDNNAGFHTVFPEGNITLTCDSDDAISVSWIRTSDDVNVANGTTLTIVGVVGTEIYSCRVWGPDCNVQLSSSVAVEPFGKIPVVWSNQLSSRTSFQLEYEVQ